MVKKILSILAWVATAAALVALFVVSREHYLNTPVKSYNLDLQSGNSFVKESDVLADLEELCKGQKIGTVDMEAIGKRLKANPWVESSAAHIGLDGTLNVSIAEHLPAMRVFGSNGQSAYITSDGLLLPPGQNYTPHLLIASGNFSFEAGLARQLSDTIATDRNLIGARKLNEAVGRNGFVKSCVGQVYCNKGNEFEIVAKDIDARIIVGDTANLDDKLRRLETFMKHKTGSNEIKEYKKINLKFKNQIVCTKR